MFRVNILFLLCNNVIKKYCESSVICKKLSIKNKLVMSVLVFDCVVFFGSVFIASGKVAIVN